MNKQINQSRQQYLPDTFSAFSKMIFNFSTWRPATAHVIIALKTSMTSFLMPSNCLVLQYLQKVIQMKLAVANEQIAVV